MSHMHPALRLTPSNSPFFKNTTPRSPTKSSRHEEPGLRLSKVIGTTTTSANGFDSLPAQRKFAYTAGAAAVVATVDDELKVQQNFFRGRPTLATTSRDANGQWPITPTPGEARYRPLGHVREQNLNGSPLGSSSRDWSDSPTGKTTSAKDRVKAATSVALSPNGKWLAVGETGYRPRILIFALQEDASDIPVTVLAEHTFGVHALRFSPDSKYLASLGTVNDGFLYVWQIDERSGNASLHASNKCTTLVNSLAWMGHSIVTVGLRFVKVWRPDEEAVLTDTRRFESSLSPSTPRQRTDNRSSEFGNSILSPRHKVLAGKNSLLGDMLDTNFISVVPVSPSEAFICGAAGEICILDDTTGAQSLSVVVTADFSISAARIEHDRNLVVSGQQQQSTIFRIDDLRVRKAQGPKHRPRKTDTPTQGQRDVRSECLAMANLDNTVVELTSSDGISISRHNGDGESKSTSLSAHSEPVLGVESVHCSRLSEVAFFTFSGSGIIRLWSAKGDLEGTFTVPVEASSEMYDVTNELKAASILTNGVCLAAGDRYGALSIIDLSTGSVLARVRAHSAEISDICTFERAGVELLATASRDRTVQLFSWSDGKLELLQTMDEHAGAVTGLLATQNGEGLLSCSADRTVVVREAVQKDERDEASFAFLILRTITLKSAPTCFCLAETRTVLVSTMDRSVSAYNLETGQVQPGSSFKCSDAEGGEAALLSRILYSPSLAGSPTIIGIASSDKSVRLYSEHGTLIARDWGHTEGITGVALLQHNSSDMQKPEPPAIVTCAADSTLYIWDTAPIGSRQRGVVDSVGELPSLGKPTPMGPPLRKVMSVSELSRLRRGSSLDNEPTSPTAAQTPTAPSSPQRLRKKTSRMSVSQTPRLDPASSRRQSIRQRSPSPPSPRNNATIRRDTRVRPSLGMSLRSKSSENILSVTSPAGSSTTNGFGTLTGSTESVTRTLRAYRKKLANSSPHDNITSDALREVEKELRLTARVLSEKSQGKSVDEAMMARLLDQASEKIVGMLDERIKERVESEVRKSSEGSPSPYISGATDTMEDPPADTLAGAFENVKLSREDG